MIDSITGYQAGMESSPRATTYEYTPVRLVLISVGAVLLVLFAMAAALAPDDASAGFRLGAFIGRLIVSLAIAWVVRAIARAIRGRSISDPGWTPALLFTAAFVALVSAAGAAAPD